MPICFNTISIHAAPFIIDDPTDRWNLFSKNVNNAVWPTYVSICSKCFSPICSCSIPNDLMHSSDCGQIKCYNYINKILHHLSFKPCLKTDNIYMILTRKLRSGKISINSKHFSHKKKCSLEDYNPFPYDHLSAY